MNALTISNIETEIDALAPRIAALLPPDVSPDKFRTVVLAAIRANPDLLQTCDKQSLFNAILNAAQVTRIVLSEVTDDGEVISGRRMRAAIGESQ